MKKRTKKPLIPLYVTFDPGTPEGDESVIALRRGGRRAKLEVVRPNQYVGGQLTVREAKGIVELLLVPKKVTWERTCFTPR